MEVWEMVSHWRSGLDCPVSAGGGPLCSANDSKKMVSFSPFRSLSNDDGIASQLGVPWRVCVYAFLCVCLFGPWGLCLGR